MVIWHRVVGFLIIGYLCMSRSFAYLGVPPLYIGELALAMFLFLKPRVSLGTWASSLLRASPLSALSLALLVFISYGSWQVGRGMYSDTSIFEILKFFTFNYYAIYLFLGIWIGLRSPEFLPKLFRVLAWIHGAYGLIWIAVLRDLREVATAMPGAESAPGNEISVFGIPAGGAVIILGLLCFERNLRAVGLPLALNVAVTLTLQARATWLGLAVGILVLGLLTHRLGRVAALGIAGIAVLGIIELSGIRLGPGRDTSFAEITARAIAPINLELAKELSPYAKHAAGTVGWRQTWWDGIWASVHSKPMLEAFGHGYGFPLISVAPKSAQENNEDVRTPHNAFFYALGYTGWVGVVLFAVLQFVILRLVWRSFRLAGQSAGVVLWFTFMAMAGFEGSFETPYRAIPFYLLMGMSIAPGLLMVRESTTLRIASPAVTRSW
jgi:O-Antigen ligase